MEMEFKDIKRIGHTIFRNKENGTNFICDIKTANIEYLLLRDILEKFDYVTKKDLQEAEALIILNFNNNDGCPIITRRTTKFKILKEEDFQWNDSEMCICLVTDIPYDVYLTL